MSFEDDFSSIIGAYTSLSAVQDGEGIRSLLEEKLGAERVVFQPRNTSFPMMSMFDMNAEGRYIDIWICHGISQEQEPEELRMHFNPLWRLSPFSADDHYCWRKPRPGENTVMRRDENGMLTAYLPDGQGSFYRDMTCFDPCKPKNVKVELRGNDLMKTATIGMGLIGQGILDAFFRHIGYDLRKAT